MSARREALIVRVREGGPFQRPVEPFEPVFRPPNHPRAVALREKYRLLDVAGEGADFARARRIKTWVRRRWNHGYDDPQGPHDAMDLLASAERGRSYSCGNYALTFVECCLAVGLPARQLSIKRIEADFPYRCRGNSGHQISEAYCREWGKWVVLDADANCFYTRNGAPLSALEVHRAWHEDRGRSVKQVLDQPHFVPIEQCEGFTRAEMRFMWRDFARHQTKHFYHHIHTWLVHGYSGQESRQFTNRRISFAGLTPPIFAYNFREVPFDYALQVTREEQFNWPIDRTFMQARMLGRRPSRRIEVRLQHNMPFGDHFELAVGAGPFRRVAGDTRQLTLSEGRTRLRARGVDGFGRPGHEARLVIAASRGSAT